ncbi:MAG: hypothetical protein ACREJB_18160 [Planctomycetaceae bacterium]
MEDFATLFTELWDAILALLLALWMILAILLQVVVRWLPLIAWVAFWLFAVNWTTLRRILLQGGWIALVLLWFVAILTWGTVSPETGPREIFGLTLSNYVVKMVYVSILFCIMLICGAVQLSGALGRWGRFAEEPEPDPHDTAHAH